MRRLAILVFVAALVTGAAIEIGSPYWTRHQVTDAAHAAAQAGAHALATTRSAQAAESAASKVASADGAQLEAFTQEPNGTVKVTLSKEARSYVLRRFSATRDWYEIRESASATAG